MKHLVCPLCSLALIANTQGVFCANHHQFDRAKEGYLNLLPVHHKNSREPGDAKEQLMARREFLAAGYFSPLLEALKAVVSSDTQSLLDIGCGEGYFTRHLAAHCSKADIYGIDISKSGVRLAAKSGAHNQTYVVASSHQLPIATKSMDLLLRIYAPSKDSELARVLSAGGRLVIVTPGEQHLLSLRTQIYKEVLKHPKPTVPVGFHELCSSEICFPLKVPAGVLSAALLEMTPFAWKLSAGQKSDFSDRGIVDTAHFQVAQYALNA